MSFSVAQRGRNKLSRRLRRRVNLGRGRGVKPLHLGLNQAGGSSDSRVSYLSYKLFFIFYHPAKWYVHAFVRDPFPRKLEKIVGNLLYPFILRVYPYAYPTSDRQEFLLSERYSAFEILSRLGEGKDERWKKGGKRERRGVEFSFGIERKWSVMSEDTGEKLSRLNCSRVRFFVISRGSKARRGEEVITAVAFVALSTNDSWKGDEGERGEEEKAAFARTRRPIERKFIRRLNV